MQESGEPRRRAWLAIAWTVLMVVLLVAPLPQTKQASGLDKLVHVGIFAVFGALWFRALPPLHAWIRTLLGGIVLVLTSELGQALLPWRSAEWLDAVADVLGVLIGIGVAWAWADRSHKATRRPRADGVLERNGRDSNPR